MSYKEEFIRTMAGILKPHVYRYNPQGWYECSCRREFLGEDQLLQHLSEELAGGILPVPNPAPKLTAKQKAVLESLRRHAGGGPLARISLAQLEEETGILASTVRASLDRLLNLEIIEQEAPGRHGKPATYRVTYEERD